VLDRLLAEMSGPGTIDDAHKSFAFDPRELERSDERLFTLRAAARKHKCQVNQLADVHARMELELQAITDGGKELERLEAARRDAKTSFTRARAPYPRSARRRRRNWTRQLLPNCRRSSLSGRSL
jgi:DNA repair protein RecN (Recombination protein N)